MAVGLAPAVPDGTRREHARVTRVEAGRIGADLGERLLDRPGRRGQPGAGGRVGGVLSRYRLGVLA